MADLPVKVITRQVIDETIEATLTAGQRLTDIPSLVALAARTVPTGKRVVIAINIQARVEEA